MLWEVLEALRFMGLGVGTLLVMLSGVLFVVGRSDRAKTALALGLLSVLAGGYGPELVSWLVGGEGPGGGWEGVPVAVIVPRGNISVMYPVEVAVIPLAPVDGFQVSVDWDDGSTSTEYYEGGQPASLRHVYEEEGAYLIQVTVTVYGDGGPQEAWRTGIVYASSPWRQMADSMIAAIQDAEEPGRLGGLLVKALKKVGPPVISAVADIFDGLTRAQGALGFYYGYAFYYYVSMPSGHAPGLEDAYSTVMEWAIMLLPLAFIVSVVWWGFWDFEKGGDVILYALRDLVGAVFGILAGYHIYSYAADLWNSITLPLSQLGQLSSVYAMVLSVAIFLSGFSIVAPGAGSSLAIILSGMILVVLGGLVKWLLTYALVASTPLVMVVWLIPPLRGAARMVLRLLVYMFLFTLIAAAMSYGLVQIVNARSEHVSDVVFSLSSSLIFVLAAPMITAGLMGTGPLGAIGRGVFSRMTALPRAAAGTAALAAATAATGGAAAAGLVAAAGPGAPGAPASHLPGPALLAAPMPMRRIELGPPQPPPPGIGMEAHAPTGPRLEPSKPSPLTTIRDYWRAAKGEMEIEPLSKKEKVAVHTLSYMRRTVGGFYYGFRETMRHKLGIAPPSPETLAKATKYTGKAAIAAAKGLYQLSRRVIEARSGRLIQPAREDSYMLD